MQSSDSQGPHLYHQMVLHPISYLPVLEVPLSTCFIRLPTQLINTTPGLHLHDVHSKGSLVLQVQWMNECDQIQNSFVGWIGHVSQSDGIELSIEFARSIGIGHDIRRNTQLLACLSIVPDNVPVLDQVIVEPASPEDWEMIELNATCLEETLLQQINVLYQDQMIPIWINRNSVVHVRVLSINENVCVRLVPSTQVAIAPKIRPRSSIDSSTGLETEMNDHFFEASPSLRIQPESTLSFTLEQQQFFTPQVVFVHPSNVVNFPGFSFCSKKNIQIIAILSRDQELDESAFHLVDSLNHVNHLIVTVVASFDLSPYHIAIHEKSKNELNVHNFEQVKLRIIKTNPCTIKTLKCSIVTTKPEATPDMRINEDSIQHAFENWSISGEMQKPLSCVNNASFVVLSGEDNTHNASIQCILEVEFVENFTRTDEAEGPAAATMGNHETQKKRVKFPYYALIGGTKENVPFITDFRRALPTESKLLLSKNDQPSSKWKGNEDEKEERKLSPLSFSDSFDSILAPFQANISSLVKRKEAAARFSMATPIPGATLIHGPRGSGKSTILRHMCAKFGQDKDSLAFVVWIDCRKLRGLKMAQVQEHFEQKFQQALSHAPSIIAIDDLDTLTPAESDQPGAPNEQSLHLAQHISMLLSRYRIGMMVYEEQLRKRSSSLFDLDYALTHRSIAVIVSARERRSLHEVLLRCGIIDRPILLHAPDLAQRQDILRSMLQQYDVGIAREHHDDSLDVAQLAERTEGYNVLDLKTLIQKACHARVLRSNKSSSNNITQVGCCLDVLEHFTPSRLRRAKCYQSDTRWEHIGGLVEVRRTLRETLELPLKYQRIYDLAPIRLPSGVLLYGPPGCGKTLLAAAVSHECGLNFVSVKGPEVLNKYIGASEQAVRDLFGRAAAAAPCVLFLDEFDAMAPRRGADHTGVTDRVVNQLLTFLDGIESRKGVYVLAATSRPDMIDPALLRPGRLDKSLLCGFPTLDERVDILVTIAKSLTLELEPDVNAQYFRELARLPDMTNFTGADLNALLVTAQLEAIHQQIDVDLNAETGQSKSKKLRPRISRHLIHKALRESSRPSISASDRRRYDGIYDTFIGQRSPRTFQRASTTGRASHSFSIHWMIDIHNIDPKYHYDMITQAGATSTTVVHDHAFLTACASSSDQKYVLILLNMPVTSPTFTELFFHLWGGAQYRICADGGANQLYEIFQDPAQRRECHDYHPDFIKGDFDSIRHDVKAYYRDQENVNLQCDPSQDENDLQKCLQLVMSRQESEATNVVIIGALGGRFDQEMQNVNSLYQCARSTCSQIDKVWLLSTEALVCLLVPGKHVIVPNFDIESRTCGIVPLGCPCESIQTKGLRWNLENEKLEFGQLISSSNHIEGTHVEIDTSHPVLWTTALSQA